MRNSSDQQTFNDDGTLRRKYEPDEKPEGKFWLRATIGLVLANTFILLKNVLFSSDANKQQALSLPATKNSVESVGEIVAASFETEELTVKADTGEQSNAPMKLAAPLKLMLGSTTLPGVAAPQANPVVHATTGHLYPSNDNVALYGSVPGKAISAFASEVTIGRVAAAGNAGGDDGGGSRDNTRGPNPVGDGGARANNRAPVVVAPVVLAPAVVNQTLVIALADLLRNSSDPDGDQLRVNDLATSSGKLTANLNGGWTFAPNFDDASEVTLTYTVSDGLSTVAQSAVLDFIPVNDMVQLGTDGNDTITGSINADVIDALGGDDIIIGSSGNDVIYGGAGNDRILGGDGNDVIHAGDGDDIVFAGAGNDVVFGGRGNDALFGEAGDDVLLGEAGDDTIFGGSGRDLLDGGEGMDQLDGGENDDTLIGGAGADVVSGGAGDDVIVAAIADSNDTYDGGANIDTLDLRATSASAVVNLTVGTADSADIGADTIVNIENVRTGSGADVVIGNSDANKIEPGAGTDVVSGGAGDDVIVATITDGNDTYDGGTGTDTLDLTATSADAVVDLAVGTAHSTEVGADTISQIENVRTGSGADVVIGNADANRIETGAGADVVSGGAGDDVIVATLADGNDTYDGGTGTDTLDLTATSADAVVDLKAGTAQSTDIGHDQVSSIEDVQCGSGKDTIIANDEVNTFTGGDGDDIFVFGSVAAIGQGHGNRDKILDFAVGDRIDLNDLSSEFSDAVDQAFTDHSIQRFVLIGNQQEFSKPGEMRFRYEDFNDTQITILEGNIDSDSDVEFELEIVGQYEFKDGDFIVRSYN